jgi:uncharacterized protein DUF4238
MPSARAVSWIVLAYEWPWISQYVSEPKKHHYLPVFYTKQWARPNGNLCEYSRPYKKVTTKWRHPSATGYQENLYTMPGLPPEHAQAVEKYLMGFTDDWASRAHRVLLSWSTAGVQNLTPEEKIGWARFLYALIIRTPEQIESLRQQMLRELPEFIEKHRADYEARRRPSDPLTFDEFKDGHLADPANRDPIRLLSRLLNSEFTLIAIAQMRFRTIRLIAYSGPTFLTSDRPFIMTNGLAQANAHIALPISPTILFLAERGDEIYNMLIAGGPKKLVTVVNTLVCEQSHRYVYGTDATQLRFVEKRIGKKRTASPLG